MDSPCFLRNIGALVFIDVKISVLDKKGADVNATIVAVDLTNSVCKLFVADEHASGVELLVRTKEAQ